MNRSSSELRALADRERENAQAATLGHARSRAQQAAEAWERMAETAERIEKGKANGR